MSGRPNFWSASTIVTRFCRLPVWSPTWSTEFGLRAMWKPQKLASKQYLKGNTPNKGSETREQEGDTVCRNEIRAVRLYGVYVWRKLRSIAPCCQSRKTRDD